MRVAVTGASGFVGTALCRRLAEMGCKVEAFDLRPRDAGNPVSVRSWDIGTGPLPDPPPVDAVVHVAAYVSDGGALDAVRRVNVGGTENVATSFPAARFVHISTCSVYDPHRPQVRAREEEAPAPDAVEWDNAYGRTKSEAEQLLRRIRPDAVVLRPHAIYGPGDTTLQPRLREAAERGLLPVPGDGSQLYAVTAVGNLVQACVLACSPQARPGVYNITDPDPLPLRTALGLISAPKGGAPTRIVGLPGWLLRSVAAGAEGLAGLVGRVTGTAPEPVLTRYLVDHLAQERTFDLGAARAGLGYDPSPSILELAPTW
jgi:nucleoside-diphosphate-sugar epimerase